MEILLVSYLKKIIDVLSVLNRCKFYIPLLLHHSAATSGAGNASGTARTGAASGSTAWAACSALYSN